MDDLDVIINSKSIYPYPEMEMPEFWEARTKLGLVMLEQQVFNQRPEVIHPEQELC